MKTRFTILFTLMVLNGFSQSLVTVFKDENSLAVNAGTSVMADAQANGGNCLYRPANAAESTFWYGPYVSVSAGNYLLQARIKVGANTSSNDLFYLDVVTQAGWTTHAGLWIKPNMFKSANAWQTISIPVSLPHDAGGLEIRGMHFRPGITDAYLDYVQLIPMDITGFYSPELTITANGKVGIGTNSPKEALSVNGNIRAKEVKVETANWPDYVFKPDYILPDIRETASFIQKEGHLPGMPSAAQAETHGIELGELDKMLLQKIEELTLYLIESKKETADLKSSMEKLSEKTLILENKINYYLK